ncbi:MAG: hypothetical protein IJH42_04300, partial [Atopobiaceae bacterium]|nr:hypothetical protein [Atopobiaceae bacterium]
YRRAIRLRRELAVVREGTYHELKRASGNLYVYAREMAGERLLVLCSFADHGMTFSAPRGYDLDAGTLELGTYEAEGLTRPDEGRVAFRPYECRVYRFVG